MNERKSIERGNVLIELFREDFPRKTLIDVISYVTGPMGRATTGYLNSYIEDGTWYLDTTYTHEGYRRQGLSRERLKTALKYIESNRIPVKVVEAIQVGFLGIEGVPHVEHLGFVRKEEPENWTISMEKLKDSLNKEWPEKKI